MTWVVRWLALLLEPGEREVVCGDLAELRVSAAGQAKNIAGLVLRRQGECWTQVGPWLALLGVGMLSAYFLSEPMMQLEGGIGIQLRTYLRYGVAYEPGGVSLTMQIVYLVTLAASVGLWIWACGFVLAKLSGRAVSLVLVFFYFIVRDGYVSRLALTGAAVWSDDVGWAMLRILAPWAPTPLVLMGLLGLGMRAAWRGRLTRRLSLLCGVVGVALMAGLIEMDSWMAQGFASLSGQIYVAPPLLWRLLPLVLGAWPLLSLPLFVERKGAR